MTTTIERREMDHGVFEKLRTLIHHHSGIVIDQNKKEMISSRLARRIRSLGLLDEFSYIEHLAENFETELVHLLDAVSTNVTHFFREEVHFRVLSHVLRVWLGAGKERVRIWCAASSTGQEPYSILITAMEEIRKQSRPVDFRLLATDISTRVLKAADEGRYSDSDLAPIPAHLRSRYFEPDGDGAVVSRTLRDLAVFHRMNLIEMPFAMSGPMDVIFCRNVMIYFEEELRENLFREFHRLLRPGGLLIVGLAESVRSDEGKFSRVGKSVYRRNP